MNFLFLSVAYPDVSHNENLYTALTNELADRGHNIRVVAPEFSGETGPHTEGAVEVIRVHSGPIFNTDVVRKGMNTVLLCRRFRRAIQSYWSDWQPDWVITSTPPITLGPLLKHIRNATGAKCYLILRDIFPQNAKDLGMMTNPLLFHYFRSKEKHLYDLCDIIGCMSPENIRFVKQQNPEIPDEKLTLLQNWIQPSGKHDNQLRGSFRRKHGFENKFIALFGGNFGRPQRISFILDLAEKAHHLDDVAFVLIGNGTEKPLIEKDVAARNLTNVHIFEQLPRTEYQALSREADIGLVTLSEKFTIPNIPSRTLGYWDAGLPILAATDKNTDYKESLLDKYNAGLWAETGDLEAFYTQFMRFYQDPDLRRELGANGRRAVEKDFAVGKTVDKLLGQIGVA